MDLEKKDLGFVFSPGPFSDIFPTPGPLRFQRNLRGRPFLRFRRNRKERQDFFPEPSMARFSHGIFDSGEKSRRKKRESGKFVLFLSEKGPSSAVENRLRFSTADEGPFSERKRTLVCRRKSQAIFDGRRRVPSDSEGIGGDDGSLRAPIEDRCPERSRKKKSWICLCPFGALDKSVIAQKIACDFLSDLRFFFSRKKDGFSPTRVFFSSAPAGQRE